MAWYWPDVSSFEKSRGVAHRGAIACFYVGGVTAVVAGASMFGRPFLGLDASFFNALLFLVAGFGIWKLSRFWAVVGLVLYVIGAVFGGFPSGSIAEIGGYVIVTAIVTGALIAGVRGTFAHHRLRPKPKFWRPESSVIR